MTILTAQHISKRFVHGASSTTVLDDASLTVAQSECVAILGPSGSGKSTLLNILGLIETPNEGELSLMGQPLITANSRERTEVRRQSIGYVFQQFNLIPVMSVFDNVAYPLMLLGWSTQKIRSRVTEVLSQVGLHEFQEKKPEQLSGGQCQRVAIARALAKSPAILIADEPTASLDAETAVSVIKAMRRLADHSGTSCIIATHDQRLLPYSDRVLFVEDGRIVPQKANDAANKPIESVGAIQ